MHLVNEYSGGFVFPAIFALLGTLAGWLVVIVSLRLPEMLERRWAAETADAQSLIVSDTQPHASGGILAESKSPVARSVRLFFGLFCCAALFAWCGWRWGPTWSALMWSGLGASLICLAIIDWETTLLPDEITLPLLWAGLCASGFGLTGTAPEQAIWGAAVGYLSLWSMYWAALLITGNETMGYGDFKFLAALGAWFGLPVLLPLILISSITALVAGICLSRAGAMRQERYVPFGPFISLAGLLALVVSPNQLLALVGL
jgi:leader peptidase (prepilin peptidase)/N-methyltransferase